MDLITRLALLAGNLACLSLILRQCLVLLSKYTDQAWIAKGASERSIGLVLLGSLINFLLVRPLRSPLRHVQRVRPKGLFGLSLVTEQPRGISSLGWFKQYPDADMVRLGTGAIIPASPRALRDILSTNSYDFEKPSGARAFLARIIGYGLILSEGSDHREQRKLLTPAFNIKRIRAMYPLMWKKTGIMLAQLETEIEDRGDVEITSWASRVTLDIIGPVAISHDFNSLINPHQVVEEAFAVFLNPTRQMQLLFGLSLALPQWFIRNIPISANREMAEARSLLRSECQNILNGIKDAEENDKGRENRTQANILESLFETGSFTDEQLIDQMCTFIGAGHETTASTISWVAHLLTLPEYRQFQTILREEIRAVIKSPGDGQWDSESAPSSATLDTLPYLNGICEETLRLFPTVPNTARVSTRETRVADVNIPSGVMISIVPYAINRNPRYWGEDAEKMIPERWIDNLPDGSRRFNKTGGVDSNFSEVTFLHGTRQCIGRDFAKAELRAVITGLFGRFEFSRLPGDDGEVVVAGTLTIKPKGGLRVKLRRIPGW